MRNPAALVSTDALAAMLGDPALRLFDCTTTTVPPPPGDPAPYIPVSGRPAFEQGHIPGANYLDIQRDFSDPNTHLRFMLDAIPRLEAAFGRAGIGDGTRVVLYSAGSMMMSTRFWWMLHALGFEAAVLDGGLDKWRAEGRALKTGVANPYPPARFVARPREGLFVDRAHVLAQIGKPGSVTVNALNDDYHTGRAPSRYGRPGRVPGSVQVSAATLVDPATKALVPLETAAELFKAKGVTPDRHVVCYCGGGISATIDLFLLHQLGYDDLALYDGSMGDWAPDARLPIETGA